MDLTTTTLTVLREQSNYSHFHIILGMVLFLLCLLSFLSLMINMIIGPGF